MAYYLEAGLSIALNNTPTTATYASGGAQGATSVVIAAANSNIYSNQIITGTGLAAGTVVTSVSGTTVNFSPAATAQISGTLNFSTQWYRLTDHNRRPIDITTTRIEKENRMANGTLRKYVVDTKDIISTSWEFVPANDKITVNDSVGVVDHNYSIAWLSAFYNANAGLPIYLKVAISQYTDPNIGLAPTAGTYVVAQTPGGVGAAKIYQVFISEFSRTISKRTKVTDYVDCSIEFTEI